MAPIFMVGDKIVVSSEKIELSINDIHLRDVGVIDLITSYGNEMRIYASFPTRGRKMFWILVDEFIGAEEAIQSRLIIEEELWRT